MITIQSVMLVLLGVFSAGLVVFVFAPAYRRRVARLAVTQLKQSMPLTETEIRADKDRLRAEYAIRIHKLALQVEEAKAVRARQVIDLNRRDAAISALQSEVDGLTSRIEESDNARLVLEQTIQDRIPKIEHRLAEAKKLIFQRDRDIATLTTESERTLRALDETMQINAQQRSELGRLKMQSVTRGATSRDSLADPKFDTEVALRAEIEGLRAQGRDQAALIARLQAALGGAAGALESVRQAGAAGDVAAGGGEAEPVVRNSVQAEAAVIAPVIEAGKLRADLQVAKQKLEEQAGEIAQLRAALEAYDTAGADPKMLSVRDSRIALKSKLGSLQSQVDTQGETIKRLRAEVASANERLAQQAAQFMNEMRRLGAGTLPASGPPRRREATRRSLSDRVAQLHISTAEVASAGRVRNGADDGKQVTPTAPVVLTEAARVGVAAHIKALAAPGAVAPPLGSNESVAPSQGGTVEAPRRSRLMQRIADIGKS